MSNAGVHDLLRHDYYMDLALAQAQKSFDEKEIPVGAVLVNEGGHILSTGSNQPIRRHDPSAHAEIIAIRAAGQNLKNYRLLNTTLYVTLEPCVMCMGAIIHARISRVVFGAADPKWGGAGSLYDFAKDVRFNHHPQIISGVCENRCKELLTEFFKIRRQEIC